MDTPDKRKILILEDEVIKRTVMEDELRDAGYVVTAVGSPLQAEGPLKTETFDVILTDLRMPGQDGISFLREVRGKLPNQAVVVMTAYGTVETAVEAMKLGAIDYIQKPFSTAELLLKLDRVVRYDELSRENTILRETLARQSATRKIVGDSEAIRKVLGQIRAIAGVDTSVLISGESGTGKELVARKIHEASHRASGQFVAVSCAALPRDLVEAELFGHEAGAFTGAARRRLGRFELAHGGTLFLDDVDDIPIETQVKLLRVLQDQSFDRVGGEQPIKVNVRIIAATKKSLTDMAAAGRFREDLYYRLNVVPIHIPPLRDRSNDIPLLVAHFFEQIALRLNRGSLTISPAALVRLEVQPWPGNVRQLEHLLERMVALSDKDHFDAEDVPESTSPGKSTFSFLSLNLDKIERVHLPSVIAEVDRRLVEWATERSAGNLARAASLLGVPRSTLQYKVEKLGSPEEPLTS